MRKLPPAPVPYAKALPAPVATWLARRKLPLSQWGAVRVCLFCFEFFLGRGAAPRCNVCAWSLSLSFSTAHAAAIPLPFDALPRRVTPKLAGYTVSQWGALTALGF